MVMVAPGWGVSRQRWLALLLALYVSALAAVAETPGARPPPTPLAANGFAVLPSSARIDEYLRALTNLSSHGKLIALGTSAGGRPLLALCISQDGAFCERGISRRGKLAVLLVASQHGTEPSGAEALQRVAGELLLGSLRSYQEAMDFVLIVNANPDGRDAHRRVNANGVNLSTDYLTLSQPESRAVVDVLHRFRPHVVLDMHESALLKKHSLGAEGYLVDFEAQFETANNPNVEPGLGDWTRAYFLPALVDVVNARGLPAGHYVGEITDIHQPITHGGLSLRTLRNYAGLLGSVSFLVENRLDPPGDYPSPRNIAVRVDKQFLSVASFLARCLDDRAQILQRVQVARQALDASGAPQLYLTVYYAPTPGEPTITLPLRRRATGERELRTFDYHGSAVGSGRFTAPHTYYVLAHEEVMAGLLDRHGIAYSRLEQPVTTRVVRQRIGAVQARPGKDGAPRVLLDEEVVTRLLETGVLRVDLDGWGAHLVPLLLDPRSASSVFQTATYAELLAAGTDFFIVRSAETTLSHGQSGPEASASAHASGDQQTDRGG